TPRVKQNVRHAHDQAPCRVTCFENLIELFSYLLSKLLLLGFGLLRPPFGSFRASPSFIHLLGRLLSVLLRCGPSLCFLLGFLLRLGSLLAIYLSFLPCLLSLVPR